MWYITYHAFVYPVGVRFALYFQKLNICYEFKVKKKT